MIQDLYITGDYLKKNPTWHLGESPWKAREILRMLQRNKLTPSTICEVGCGAGEILKLLQEHMGSECAFQGYEISPQAFAMARSKENERLHFKLMDIAQEKSAFFDLVLVMDVIEHVEDYYSFLRMIRPRGQYKIMQVPLDISVRSILKGHLISYREQFGHIHYFTKEVALQMFRDLGYEVIDYSYTANPIEPPTLYQPGILRKLRRFIGNIARGLLHLPRRLAFAIHQDIAVHIFGEWRLLVLVK